ncbi:hypothetical protein [Flavobacterium tibetense]|uniref:Uncharacterized protein n=1 Tax=Flavobacterium tibetense TaxID=2233533 RepID=A0A365P2F8_9FLAO|nr:hypothetical protein [Flavobacterium tibetense]RBA28673.1 hypothetical protein DPN68_06585 [Flavobacterium tibetense]
MMHLIWSIINGVLTLYFLYLIIGFIIKGKEIFNPKLKKASIFIMVLGIIQIISASNSEKKLNRILLNQDNIKEKNSTIKKVTLENNFSFEIIMLIKYSIEEDKYIPVESFSHLNGFTGGFEWEFNSINVNNYNKNKKNEFSVYGILKWNLFGINIYSQPKTLNGIIE